MFQNNESFGAWVSALGNTLSAIASTEHIDLTEELRTRLNVYGEVLQATGGGLTVDAIEEWNADRIGNGIQSIGNLTTLYGITMPVSDDKELLFNIQGNLIQALGAAYTIVELEVPLKSRAEQIGSYGLILEIMGNSMEALAGIQELRKVEGQPLNAIGAWTQVIGTVLSAIATEDI